MQPVAPQDRPKLVAVVIGIVIALVLVVRNLLGTLTMAQPKEEEKAATPPAPATPATPPADPVPAAASLTSAEAPPAQTDSAVPAEMPPLRDPFRPAEPVPAPAPAAPAPAGASARTPAPVLPPVLLETPMPARPAEVAIAVRHTAPAPRVEPAREDPAPAPAPAAQPAEPPAAPAPAAPAAEVRLVGTVRQDLSGVAVFRTSERAIFLRPKEVIGAWRVVQIEEGEVTLAHNDTQEMIHVGDNLPGLP